VRPNHTRHIDQARDIHATHALRLGFRQIQGVREDDMRLLMQHRGAGYDSVRDLWLRTGLTPAVLERLAAADACRSLGLDRRDALWAVRGLNRAGDKDDLPLFAAAAEPPAPAFIGPSAVEAALAELDLDGMSPREAMEALYRLRGLAKG
jgi:error-prone DNA polymerase